MELNYVRMGRMIKSIRESRGLSQENLAEFADRSVTFISNIETGKGKPSLETILNIAEVLDVPLDVLMCRERVNVGAAASELQKLMSDCSQYELTVLLENARTLKKILRENKDLPGLKK